MSYIILDLEFNQAYDFINNCHKDPWEECRFEIIQIGVVKLDSDFNIVGKKDFFIKPILYKQIHPYVKKITSITEDMLKDKPYFDVAFKNFLDFVKPKKNDNVPIFCIWGSNDIYTLYKNMKFHNLLNEVMILKYVDIQELTGRFLNKQNGCAIGLKTATTLLNIPINEVFHDALNDALYTARIFQKIKPNKMNIKFFNTKNALII